VSADNLAHALRWGVGMRTVGAGRTRAMGVDNAPGTILATRLVDDPWI